MDILPCGAGDGTRTHDILLGKQTLYRLSYTRVRLIIALAPARIKIVVSHKVAKTQRILGY
jgi:hypothetical protein